MKKPSFQLTDDSQSSQENNEEETKQEQAQSLTVPVIEQHAQQLFLPSPTTLHVSPRSEELNEGPSENSGQYALEQDFIEESKDFELVGAENKQSRQMDSQESNGMQGTQGAQVESAGAAALQLPAPFQPQQRDSTASSAGEQRISVGKSEGTATVPSQTAKHLQVQARSKILEKHLMRQFYDNTIHGIGNELKIEEVFPGHHMLQLWNLWELLITETPLLVVGGDPSECSHAILTALSLITPLTTQADFRPYVTVQNDDVLEYHDAIKQGQVGNLILGISSPLLARNFQQFPAILHMDSSYFRDKKFKDPAQCAMTSKILRAKRS